MNPALETRIAAELERRAASGLDRRLSVHDPAAPGLINLASNDYLDLAHNPRVIEAARSAADRYGCSASASPLITGYGPAHHELEDLLKTWSGWPSALVWNTGYAANQAVLGTLPQAGDVVLADRLIHNSMVAGILRSGARLRRYRHLDLDQLEHMLAEEAGRPGVGAIFVVTESVFSMDGDYPDLRRIAALRERFPFCWVLDEAHGLGWYGARGAGLAEAAGLCGIADVVVGTLGKALGSMGAYTLFRDDRLRRFLINQAGEFIYSTYLSPVCAAAASEAIRIVAEHPEDRPRAQELSRSFRARLRTFVPAVPDGDSPIIPVVVGEATRALRVAASLRERGFLVGAVRPPTVPEGTSRLRLSLKSTLDPLTVDALVGALGAALEAS